MRIWWKCLAKLTVMCASFGFRAPKSVFCGKKYRWVFLTKHMSWLHWEGNFKLSCRVIISSPFESFSTCRDTCFTELWLLEAEFRNQQYPHHLGFFEKHSKWIRDLCNKYDLCRIMYGIFTYIDHIKVSQTWVKVSVLWVWSYSEKAGMSRISFFYIWIIRFTGEGIEKLRIQNIFSLQIDWSYYNIITGPSVHQCHLGFESSFLWSLIFSGTKNGGILTYTSCMDTAYVRETHPQNSLTSGAGNPPF